MTTRLRAGVALVAAMVIGLVLAGCGSDDDPARDLDAFTFESLEVDYTLTRAEDGTSRMRVVEEFVAVFPDTDQNRGMRRLLPEEYNDQPLNPSLVSVTDETGAELPVETDSDDGTLGILTRGEEYLHGRHTFVFTYDLENVVWRFPDTGEEFNWDVNGSDWPQPFGRVTARLHLDSEIAGTLTDDASCYAGGEGSTDFCSYLVVEGDDTVIATANEVAPYETLTFAVGFEDGTFELFDSSYLASPFGWAQAAAALLLVGALGWAVRNRRRYLLHSPGRATIIAEYAPPSDVDALESAVLLHRNAKAIPAEVLEQAIVGSIRIVEGEKPRWGTAKLQAELVDPSLADGDGRMLLAGLFPAQQPGDVFEFGSSDTRLSSTAQQILKAAAADLQERGMYRDVPRGARAWPLLLGELVALLVIVLGVFALAGSVDAAIPVTLMVVAFIAMFVFLLLLIQTPLSERGSDVRDHLAGLKQFIEWAEEDRIRALQSPTGAERVSVDTDDPRSMLRLYEGLLPYAVVFGQEKEWSRHLAVLYAAAGVSVPVWYAGSGSFDASTFAAGIGTLSASASSSSSTSGGSAGGGSAGGGGGGGGGGGA